MGKHLYRVNTCKERTHAKSGHMQRVGTGKEWTPAKRGYLQKVGICKYVKSEHMYRVDTCKERIPAKSGQLYRMETFKGWHLYTVDTLWYHIVLALQINLVMPQTAKALPFMAWTSIKFYRLPGFFSQPKMLMVGHWHGINAAIFIVLISFWLSVKVNLRDTPASWPPAQINHYSGWVSTFI